MYGRFRVLVNWAFKCLVRRGRKIRLFVLTRSTNKSSNASWSNWIESMYPRKMSQIEHRKFVLKPTLVDKSSRLRRLEDRCLRNSANYLGVSYARCPAWDNTRATTKEYTATVYHKHRSMLTRKGMYMGWNLTGARRLNERVIPDASRDEPVIEALVNVSSNSNCSKVAKSFVG